MPSHNNKKGEHLLISLIIITNYYGTINVYFSAIARDYTFIQNTTDPTDTVLIFAVTSENGGNNAAGELPEGYKFVNKPRDSNFL